MARNATRSSGLFSGLVLISVGVLILLHNYGRLELGEFFRHWWPLLIIFWGLVKLYERTVGRRFGGGSGGVTGGEVFLVLAMLALMGIVVAKEYGKHAIEEGIPGLGDRYSFDIDVAPKTVPANAHVLVRNGRGDIVVRSSDNAQIHVTAKKTVRTWSESDAERLAKPVSVEIIQNGDGIEVRPTGYDLSDSRIGVEMDLEIPKTATLAVKTDKGDVTVSEISADVSITDRIGDVEVRNAAGDINIELGNKGGVKLSEIKGNVKISGKGDEIEVLNTSGSLTVDGDFYGPVRADKVAKGVRINGPKIDLTLTALAGHLEASTGNLDVIDSKGNLISKTRDTEINIENPGGKVVLENRNAPITVRFSSTPKEDVQITNSSAAISVIIPGSSSFEVQADCRNCSINSEFPGLQAVRSTGEDSSLSGKYGNGRGPKITLKTSYEGISLQRMSIELPPRPGAPPAPPSVPSVPKVPGETEQ